MEQTVYVDLYFLINFSMDFLCFFLASRLLGERPPTFRTVMASLIGGVYANVSLILGAHGIVALAADLLSCVLMCAVAFGVRKKARRLPLYVLVYFAVSMTLGGFMTALFNLLNRTPLGDIRSAEEGLSAWLLALLAAVSALMTLWGGKYFRRRTSKRNVRLSVFWGGKSADLKALCDSGNMLRDPISGKLCVIASVDALKGVLPTDMINAVRDRGKSIGALSAAVVGMRVIPVRTAAGESMMFAVNPEGIVVEDGESKYRVDALLALSDIGEIADGAEALLPSELLS